MTSAPSPLLGRRPVPAWLVGALLAVLALPLVVALVELRRRTWFPVLDHAMAELRVRDVGTRHTPLVGLPGRIGTFDRQGSHPGPASFYALAPVHRLLGSSAWSLQAATAAVHVVAMAAALVVARMRFGVRGVLGVAAVLAVATAAFGPAALTEPWNPYLPLLWWVTFLLCAWSVAIGDWRLLPLAVLSATFCAQTHLPYLGMTAGIGVVAVLAGAVRPVERRPGGPVGPWFAVTAVVAVLLWSPVVVDQVRNDPGNLVLLREHLLDPPEASVGFATGARVVLEHLDLTHLPDRVEGGSGSLVDPAHEPQRSAARGAVLLVVWVVGAVLAWHHRLAVAGRLHLVVGAGMALAVVAVARIFGRLWYYLTLWAWSLGILAAAAAVWTIVEVVARARPAAADRLRTASAVAAAVVVLACVGAVSAQATSVGPPAERLSAGLELVVEPTAEALRAGAGAADGEDGRYVVRWADALWLGSPGYGLLSELERRGFDVGAMPGTEGRIPAHRTLAPADATAAVQLTTGRFIDEWRSRPGSVEVAYGDPRTPEERDEYERLRTEALDDLAERGLSDLVPLVDGNLFGAALDPRLDDDTRDRLGRMLEIGPAVAVFVVPADSDPFAR